MNLIHNVLPYLPCISSSVYTRHIAGDIVAYPDGCRVVAGIAAEPGILAAVGGAGFSGCRHIVFKAQASASAVGSGEGAL